VSVTHRITPNSRRVRISHIMTSLFDSDSLSRSRELLEEGAVLLRGFATAEAPLLVEEVRGLRRPQRYSRCKSPLV
jgi:hypothetical protein